jgi:hypothetical protein
MNASPLQNLFFIDIETVSGQADFHLLDDGWKRLWTEKITRSLPPDTTAEEYYPQRAAILAEFAKVVCISFAYLKNEGDQWKLKVKSLYSDNEKELLSQFEETLKQLHANQRQWVFAGHNIKEFDIPFLCRRILVNGMKLPEFMDFQNKKPWETPVLDTLHLWRFGDYKHYITLKLLAAVLGVPSPKDDIDGSQVGNVFWKEKDLKRIAEYCQKDVITVANILLKFNGLPLLADEHIVFAT